MGLKEEKYTSEKELARTRPQWKNTDTSCTETPWHTSKTQPVNKKGLSVRYIRQVERGLLWDGPVVFFTKVE